MIQPSLRALLGGVIDYAGLFPPAKLPVERAWANYLSYLGHGDAWMLGGFVCPASRLGELPPLPGQAPQGAGPVRVTALGRGGATAGEFLANLALDLADIKACLDRHGGKVAVPVFETKLPVELLPYDHRQRDLLAAVAEATVVTRMALFFEAPPDDGELLERLLTALGETPFASPVGYKLRTGGLEPSAFPSCSRLALTLATCLHAAVPLKATAGLHHPLPRFDSGVRARMHGFVNLLVACVLGRALRLPASVLQQVLEEEDARQFSFAADRLAWRDRAATTEQVARGRQTAILSLGSCSFDEPRDDLRSLGWL